MESGPWATRRASRRRPSRVRPAPTQRLPPRGAGPTQLAWVAPTERDHRRGFYSRERPGRCCGRATHRARRATETAETPRRRQPRTAETPRQRPPRERPRSPGRRPGRTLACRRARAAPRPSRLRSRYLLDIPSSQLTCHGAAASQAWSTSTAPESRPGSDMAKLAQMAAAMAVNCCLSLARGLKFLETSCHRASGH